MSFGAAARTAPVYQLGTKCLLVSMGLHGLNRKSLCDRLKAQWAKLAPVPSLQGVYVVLQGGTESYVGSSDTANVFRQESYFHWAFGGLEPDWYGVIEVETLRSILFIPRTDDNTAIYSGVPAAPDEITVKYAVNETHYVDEMESFFKKFKPTLLLTLHGLNTDSDRYTQEAKFPGIEQFKVDNKILHPIMAECRVFKNPCELDVIRYACRVSSAAHRHLMRCVKPGMHEFEAESLFSSYCYFHGGMRHMCYTCIAASGKNCAVLHYGHAGAPNERVIQDGDLCLFDMGGEYYCYCSDITCTFPANGHFTDDQKLIYEAVYAASRAVLGAARPGASWVDLHKLAEKQILTHLLEGGLLQGSVDEMMAAKLGAVFMPHGLGHLMGCDVHDVGGYNPGQPPRIEEPGLRNLRTARKLEPNMVITVEPGCYFIDKLLDDALASEQQKHFLVASAISRFRGFGGVRIEDNIVITENGHELLTDVPRTVQEIEEWMAVPPEGQNRF
ncbi:unnamed protein product [Calicophoron daubneyi]|uniref:Xaa-Pro dipeptidase n=1 Tax=Calicophoron daubneyi TaxID=300641 RepID=A0AAV2TGJ6_CALDB